MNSPAGAVVIYDDECGMCSSARAWLEPRARPGTLEFVACRSEERALRFPGVARAACEEALQLVLPDSRVLSGEAALPEILRRLRHWAWLAPLLRMPLARRFNPVIYRWIAKHRRQLSCALPGPRARG